MGGSRVNIKFWNPNKEIINGLIRAINRIEEQDRKIETLRKKLHGKKEILKDELMIIYHQFHCLVLLKQEVLKNSKQKQFHEKKM